MKKIITLVCIAVGFGALHADQFAYVEPEIAQKAVFLLQKEPDMFLLCEPCGESKGRVVRISKVEEVDVKFEGLHEVRVNGTGIDFAYTYIRRNGKWKNLAVELGLNPQGVKAVHPFSNLPITTDKAR